jgi:hypothetical protein
MDQTYLMMMVMKDKKRDDQHDASHPDDYLGG